MRRVFCALFLLFFPASGWISAQEIPDSLAGFDAQFQELFKAYQANEEREFKSLADQFAIPVSWFPQVFGIAQGKALAAQYAEEFSDFEPHLRRNLQSVDLWKEKHQIDARAPTKITIELWRDPPDSKKLQEPVPATLVPLPQVEKFSIGTAVMINGNGVYHNSVSWMDSFIYVDGRFRFFGRGSSTLWKPGRIRRADPCARPGHQTGGELVFRTDPVYPADAWNNRVEGFVKAVLAVDKTGRVKSVEIVEGHPLLVEAAREAFMQWQYTPFMNCGRSVEMSSFEHVDFSIPK